MQQYIPALNATIQLPDKPTVEGDALIQQMLDEIVAALTAYYNVKDEISK